MNALLALLLKDRISQFAYVDRLRMEVGNNLYAAEKLLDLLRGQLVELSK